MKDILGYQGKRVVVSGCFSGMGEATAQMLLDVGAEVHGLDFKESKLKLASFNLVDLRNEATIAAGVKAIGGKIDALFNCAGLPQTAPPMDVMKVNFIGTRELTNKIIPLMSAGGAIASIASTGGMGWQRRLQHSMELLQAESFDAAVKWCEGHLDVVREGYSFSKEAVMVWTMVASSKLIKKGIRINCTLPGPTQTPMMKEFESATQMSVLNAAMQPINRRSTPAEQAGPLVYLNSDIATYVNGHVLAADGGFMGGAATGQIDMSALMPKQPA
jgi:NAD(P)-dependent dehydrogenase (short-subunit alcohol dehydrogenase family)